MLSIFARLSMALSLLFSCAVFAADIPQDDIDTHELTQTECIDENTQDCINDSCLTSEDIDCPDNCKSMAEAKCQQQSDE